MGRSGDKISDENINRTIDCCFNKTGCTSDLDSNYNNSTCDLAMVRKCQITDKFGTGISKDPRCQEWWEKRRLSSNPAIAGLVREICSGSIWNNDPDKADICKDWCKSNPGRCDRSAEIWCSANKGDPFCACYQSPVLDSSVAGKLINVSPKCVDQKCNRDGYWWTTLNRTQCTGTVINCAQKAALPPGMIMMGNVTIDQSCSADTGSRPPPPLKKQSSDPIVRTQELQIFIFILVLISAVIVGWGMARWWRRPTGAARR